MTFGTQPFKQNLKVSYREEKEKTYLEYYLKRKLTPRSSPARHRGEGGGGEKFCVSHGERRNNNTEEGVTYIYCICEHVKRKRRGGATPAYLPPIREGVGRVVSLFS